MRRSYSDPTANMAIGNVMREQRRKENERAKRKGRRRETIRHSVSLQKGGATSGIGV